MNFLKKHWLKVSVVLIAIWYFFLRSKTPARGVNTTGNTPYTSAQNPGSLVSALPASFQAALKAAGLNPGYVASQQLPTAPIGAINVAGGNSVGGGGAASSPFGAIIGAVGSIFTKLLPNGALGASGASGSSPTPAIPYTSLDSSNLYTGVQTLPTTSIFAAPTYAPEANVLSPDGAYNFDIGSQTLAQSNVTTIQNDAWASTAESQQAASDAADAQYYDETL